MCKNNSYFPGFLTGLAVGSLLGILYAPAEGEKTRKMLDKKTKDYRKKGGKILAELEKAAEPYVQEVEERIEPIEEKIQEVVHEVEKETEPLREKTEEAIKRTKQRFFKGVDR